MSSPKSRRTLRDQNLPLHILKAREVLLARFRPVLAAHAVTEQQWRVMRALLEHGALEPRQIGELCNLSSPSLTGVLARMAATGMVLRRRIAHDQRRLLVKLTPKGRARATAMLPEIAAVYRRLETAVGADFIADLHRTLDALIASLR